MFLHSENASLELNVFSSPRSRIVVEAANEDAIPWLSPLHLD
jgi:hypothetical protein